MIEGWLLKDLWILSSSCMGNSRFLHREVV
jgi:hypothetical protein